MTTFNAMYLVDQRNQLVPSDVPSNAIIFNAPRPLLGKDWTGDFRCGIFYAAVAEDDPYKDQWIAGNKALDATVLVFLTETEARERVTEYLKAEGYGEIEKDLFEEFWKDSFYNSLSNHQVEI